MRLAASLIAPTKRLGAACQLFERRWIGNMNALA
jgi:hypothetical protein